MDEALEACSLYPVTVYAQRRRDQIRPYLSEGEVFQTCCVATPRKAGTPTGLTFYWQQQEIPDQAVVDITPGAEGNGHICKGILVPIRNLLRASRDFTRLERDYSATKSRLIKNVEVPF